MIQGGGGALSSMLMLLTLSSLTLVNSFSRSFGASIIKPQRRAGVLASAFATAAPTGTATKANPTLKYSELCKELKEIDALEGILGILGWDEQVMMPPGAAESRGKMKASLAGTLHEKRTHPSLGEKILALDRPEVLKELPTEYDRANVRLAKRDWDLQTRKSKEMASKEAELEAKGYGTWVKARKENDFASFAPVLKEIVELKAQIAKAVYTDRSGYDANIDIFEKNMKAARLVEIFGALKADVVPLLKSIMSSPRFKNASIPPGLEASDAWDKDAQAQLSKEISSALGFDYEKGRIDTSPHPFTGGAGPTDVRITTRYSNNWLEGVAGTVHEVGHGLYDQWVGHGLYEQGRSVEQRDLPVSRALSMGVHESQSLLWERMVFQGRPFWDFATPLFHKYFPHTKELTSEQFYRHINTVRPGLIRVNADEVTYPLHIILRFQVEQALFNGSMQIDELPSIWNKAMKDLLDVDVPSNDQGVLQDVHWPVGAIGYFPSYTLGSMMAAQLFEQANKELPTLGEKLAKGEFSVLREWLRGKIHVQGSLHDSLDELLVAVTGKPLDPSIFVQYLKEKYTALYDLDVCS